MRIPLWFGNDKDTFTAEHWIKRLETMRTSNNWTDTQTACHAQSALREKALMLVDYLDDQDKDSKDWNIFKKAFLDAFGNQTRDNSKILNLHLSQRPDEKANIFGWRVAATVREYFTSIENITPNTFQVESEPFPAILGIAVEQEPGLRTWVRDLLAEERKQQRRIFGASLGRNIFLNGLNLQLRLLTKYKDTQNMFDAVEAAVKVEKIAQGPTDKFSTEKNLNAVEEAQPSDDDTTPDVNYIKRKRQPFQSKSTFTRRNGPMECWYCHKKNHMQINCRIRLSRGAQMVPRPRTVQEIQLDRMTYQELDDSDEEDNTDTTQDISTLTMQPLN